MIKNNQVIRLRCGKKGKVIGQVESGEHVLMYGKGGKIAYFKEDDVIVNGGKI